MSLSFIVGIVTNPASILAKTVPPLIKVGVHSGNKTSEAFLSINIHLLLASSRVELKRATILGLLVARASFVYVHLMARQPRLCQPIASLSQSNKFC